MKYQRLINRRKELFEISKRDQDNINYLMEMDCLDHFFGAGGIETYEKIALLCKERNIQRVVDIGSAYGHQSEIFLQQDIGYIGVNEHKDEFWNQDKFDYIVGRYPCELPVDKADLGISVLCLTWNCYLYEGEKTLREQCEALQSDFDHCLLYIAEDKVQSVAKYFNTFENVGRNLWYFSVR